MRCLEGAQGRELLGLAINSSLTARAGPATPHPVLSLQVSWEQGWQGHGDRTEVAACDLATCTAGAPWTSHLTSRSLSVLV